MEIPGRKGVPKYPMERKFPGGGGHNIKTLHGGGGGDWGDYGYFWNYTIYVNIRVGMLNFVQ